MSEQITAKLRSEIEARIRRYPEHTNTRIRDMFRRSTGPNPVASAAVVADVRGSMGGGTADAAPEASNVAEPNNSAKTVTGGIALGSLNVYTQRPQNRVKGLIHKLKKGRGYPACELSTAWGISEDTIRNHAKRLHCWRYVEVTPGDYVGCVLHPDTAAKIVG